MESGKINERDDAGNGGDVHQDLNDQGGAVQRKARRLSKMAVEAETTLYRGQHGTRFGEDFLGEVTHQQNNGVR